MAVPPAGSSPGAEPPAVTDRELLDRHLGGDAQAFAALVVRHRDRLWRLALRTLGDPGAAAYAVQEAAVSANRTAATVPGDIAVRAWLERSVVDAALAGARRRSVRPETGADAGAGGGRRVPDPRAGDADAASTTATAVLDALQRVDPELAAAVVLVDVEGLPPREAAAVLDVEEGVVRTRCARARAALAGHLRTLVDGGADAAPATPPTQATGDDVEES